MRLEATRKEIQGKPKRTTPEGKTAQVFVISTNSRVPLAEALVGCVAALAWGDRYRQYISRCCNGGASVSTTGGGREMKNAVGKVMNASCRNNDDLTGVGKPQGGDGSGRGPWVLYS